jgi:NAD(P)-dependent dehydrogenase (short-subunit alcohol dehydrogenase family)
MGILDGKVVLITGSTRGIGRAFAEGFAAQGAKVWVHGLEVETGEAIACAIGGRFVAADFTQPTQVETLAMTLLNVEARLDVLINNAGIEIIMPIEKLDMEQMDRIWQVNVRAPVLLVHRLLPLLRQAGGASIINITSIHDTMPYPHNAAYSLSKAALAMFGKAAALELAPLGIRVNNLAPGAVETDINREVIHQIGHDNFKTWIPLGRVAQTEELVAPAIFLASDASSYVTGATLYVDGGYLHNLVRYRPDG